MFSRFFIERPIFASVISIVITIAGLVTLFGLPIEQFPPITPPTVQVTTSYPGANAVVLADTVAQPIEEQVNGVEGMIYMSSTCSNNGSYTLTVSFEVGTDTDMATVLVQNRVAIALPQLPEEVKRVGVTTQKQSTNMVLMMSLLSPDGRYDDLFLSNYATLRIKDELARLPGVGSVFTFGIGDYSMRFWLDPDRMQARGLTPQDVIQTIQEQNVQVAPGQIGQEPSPPGQDFTYTINTQGRLEEVAQFADIIVKTGEGGRITRISDVARIELGSRSYGQTGQLNGKPTALLGVYQLPDANALDVAKKVRAKMEELSQAFPQGLEYRIPFDTTIFVDASIKEVVTTLFIAVLLVFLTIFIFLEDWRATLVPGITIPVSLIGTFAIMGLIGFSINTLSLFGIVLAIGIVVDDAIVVVENTVRNMDEHGLSAKEASIRAMEEVSSPVIATTLVLLAVFIPTAFLGGITGQLYRQFALTIAISTLFSSINALTMSPALCAILLRPSPARRNLFFRGFEWGLNKSRSAYERVVRTLVRRVAIMFVLALGVLAAVYYGFISLPTGFVPNEDQGYAMIAVQLPDAASFERTLAVVEEVTRRIGEMEGVADLIAVPGYSVLDGSQNTNSAAFWAVFTPWEERKKPELRLRGLVGRMTASLSQIQEASVFVFVPPPITGLGTAGGFQMQLQDRGDVGLAALQQMTDEVTADANTQTGLLGVYTTFRANVPQLYMEVDRTKAKTEGLDLGMVFNTLQAYLGSYYVNDFNQFGRTFQVNVQAEADYRAAVKDIGRLQMRNAQGRMIPMATLVKVDEILGPQLVTRYNMYPSAAVYGSAGAGYSSGQALNLMEDLARAKLPTSMGFEWTGISYQEKTAGGEGTIIFLLAVIFVYLVLAAQYESWSIPMGVILAVPLALLGMLAAVALRGMDVNVYTQIGIVLLIGLASKNAILIVEFAKDARAEGKPIPDAAWEAAHLRFRPVLMTALSFVLGVVPLVVASGAGAVSRQALGTAVFGGMVASTFLTLLFVPSFYVGIQRMSEWLFPRKDLTLQSGAQGGKSKAPETTPVN